MATPTPGSPKLSLLAIPSSGKTPLDRGLDSAVSSGRSTPTGWSQANKAALSHLATDPKWKKYTAQVDKSLASFDAVKEWADFISFLSRLLRTLQAFPSFDEIPRKLLVAKRLAQCLTPALPSGVHQRTLDVYGHILKVIGPEGLRRDLLVWSSGLFPFFQYASTAAKPQLLELYEKYYLPLQGGLRPATKALILALLPGLEEETGEFFDKVMFFLDYLSSTVSPSFFLQNIWLILISAPSARPTALTYLAKRMPKLGPEDDITHIVGADISLMIRAFASCLEDTVVLVQRGILDLLVTSLRLDGAASSSPTSPIDRLLLMRAASSVVLRRDLSLSRRLYSWLCGAGETPESQVAFLRRHGLELLRESLATGMTADAGEALKSYKIFNSLLDKWEIGLPLSEVLVADTLRSFRSRDLQQDEGVSLAANTLYDSLDPFVIWQQLFLAVKADFEDPARQGKDIALLQFVLTSFTPHDDEVAHFHLPVLFASLISLLRTSLPSPGFTFGPQTLAVLDDILHLIPPSVFASDDSSPPPEAEPGAENPLPHAIALYTARVDGGQSPKEPEYNGFAGAMLFRLALEGLLDTALVAAKQEQAEATKGEELVAILRLVEQLLAKTAGREPESTPLRWQPAEWFDAMRVVAEKTKSFGILQQIVATVLELSSARHLKPELVIDPARQLTPFLRACLAILARPDCVNHAGAVHIVWDLQRLSSDSALQTTLFKDLESRDLPVKLAALTALGVLWRHDDVSDFATLDEKAVFHVLDTLSSKNVALRRAGEGWLRLNLKSFIQFIDPLLAILLDPQLGRSTSSASHNGRSYNVTEYNSDFDTTRAMYVLESLHALLQADGAAFNSALHSTSFKQASERLQKRSEEEHLEQIGRSFMDVLVEVLLQLIASEPSSGSSAVFTEGVLSMQLTAALLLHAIVRQGDFTSTALHIAEWSITNKLFALVQYAQLDLQGQLLTTLHELIRTSSPLVGSRRGSATSVSSQDEKHAAGFLSEQASSLLLQTVIDGISTPSNAPVLPQWIDFISKTVPLFRGPLRALLHPLADCLVGRVSVLGYALRFAVEEAEAHSLETSHSAPSDVEVRLYLTALEQVIALAVRSSEKWLPAGHPTKGMTESSTGLRSYVSGVFGVEDSGAEETSGSHMQHTPGARSIAKAVRALHALWQASTNDSSHSSEGIFLLCATTRTRTQTALESFYRIEPLELVQTLAELGDAQGGDYSTSLEILDALVASSQAAVALLCQILSSRAPTGTEKGAQRGSSLIDERDLVVFDFLEAYVARLDAPLAVQIWSTLFSFARDVSFVPLDPGARSFAYPALRAVTALADKVATTSALQDRRLRNELQACFTRLVEAAAAVGSRRHDSALSATVAGKARASQSLGRSRDSASQLTYANIVRFMTESVMPNLRRFLVDNERVLAICSTLNAQLVGPALKSRSSPICTDRLALALLHQITLVPGTIKLWRSLVADSFADPKFFASVGPEQARAWEPLLLALMDAEKDRLAEVISRISAPPSAGLFTSHSAEMHLRALHVRRLTALLLAGPRNHFVLHLPTVQQNLVEVLRTPGLGAGVHAEVWRALRVLCVRMGASVMGNLWPVILTELLRVFETALDHLPADESDQLTLLYAAVKFLDLLFVLQLEDFQIHQWMFVADMAVDRATIDWEPDAILDRLGEAVRQAPGYSQPADGLIDRSLSAALRGREQALAAHPALPLPPPSTLRAPLLPPTPARPASAAQLAPFLAQAGAHAFELSYGAWTGAGGGGGGGGGRGEGEGLGAAGIDWDGVERGLSAEVYEG